MCSHFIQIIMMTTMTIRGEKNYFEPKQDDDQHDEYYGRRSRKKVLHDSISLLQFADYLHLMMPSHAIILVIIMRRIPNGDVITRIAWLNFNEISAEVNVTE